MVRLLAAKSAPLTKTVALPEVPYPPAELWLLTITVWLAEAPRPFRVMYGLFAGIVTISRYVPGAMVMVRRLVLFAGTASTAACTVVYWPLPSAATVAPAVLVTNAHCLLVFAVHVS